MNDIGHAAPPPNDDGPSPQRMMSVFLIAGGSIVVIGIIVVLVMSLSGGVPGGGDTSAESPQENLPPLAEACPPPTSTPDDTNPQPPEDEEDRTVDQTSGISYREYPDPWMPWEQQWSAGKLSVQYGTGQYFVTETYPNGDYLATILSGNVEAAVNDGDTLDLECVGQEVTEDVRSNYYPQPNEMDSIRDEQTTLGGLPAWVHIFRLSFTEEGLGAADELVGVALLDVGSSKAAVLYVSIPGTHDQYDEVVEEVLDSARPVSE